MHRQTKDGAVITIASGNKNYPPTHMNTEIDVVHWVGLAGQWYRWVEPSADLIDLIKFAHQFSAMELVQLLEDDAIALLYREDGALAEQ